MTDFILRSPAKARDWFGDWTLRLPETPKSDGKERQHEDRQDDVGQGPVSVRDQCDEAEAAGNEHAANQKQKRDEEPCPMR